MNDKVITYTYKSLIEVYCRANQLHFIHPDFKAHYIQLLQALETTLGINLSTEGFSKNGKIALFMLFQATVNSYNSIRTPWSGFSDASAVVLAIDRLGLVGERIDKLGKVISSLSASNAQVHLLLLETIVEVVFGHIDKTVTSDELKAMGVRTEEPKLSDYDDYL